MFEASPDPASVSNRSFFYDGDGGWIDRKSGAEVHKFAVLYAEIMREPHFRQLTQRRDRISGINLHRHLPSIMFRTPAWSTRPQVPQ